MGAEHHALGAVVQAVLDAGHGRHDPRVVGDGPRLLVLGNVEVTPATESNTSSQDDMMSRHAVSHLMNTLSPAMGSSVRGNLFSSMVGVVVLDRDYIWRRNLCTETV